MRYQCRRCDRSWTDVQLDLTYPFAKNAKGQRTCPECGTVLHPVPQDAGMSKGKTKLGSGRLRGRPSA